MSAIAQSKLITVSGLTIHYLTAGLSGSPVLLLHGGALDSASISYKYSIGPIAQQHMVFAPDLPGHGESDKPDIEYTNEYYIDFIGRFMDALGLQSASLVGLSISGASALGFTLQSPQRVDRLVIVDSYGLGGAEPFGALSYAIVQMPGILEIRMASFAWDRSFVRWGLRSIFYDPSAITDEVVDEIYHLAQKPGSGKAWISFQRSEYAISGLRTNYVDRLKEIRTPTLIMHCLRDDSVPVTWAQRAHDLIANSRLEIISECSHWPQREQPDTFNSIVLRFLNE